MASLIIDKRNQVHMTMTGKVYQLPTIAVINFCSKGAKNQANGSVFMGHVTLLSNFSITDGNNMLELICYSLI